MLEKRRKELKMRISSILYLIGDIIFGGLYIVCYIVAWVTTVLMYAVFFIPYFLATRYEVLRRRESIKRLNHERFKCWYADQQFGCGYGRK